MLTGLRGILARAMQSHFLRNVGILTGGTAFAQGLTVLALPVLTRLYTPEAFGLLSVYVALMGFFAPIATLRFDIAIPIPAQDDEAANLLALALVITTGVALVLGVIAVLLPAQVAAWLRQEALQPYLWMVPLAVFGIATYNSLQFWSTRQDRYGLVTRTRIRRAIGGTSAQLGLGVIGAGPIGLLLGQLLNAALGISGLAQAIRRFDRVHTIAISRRSMRAAFVKYREFPTRVAPAAVLDAGYQFLPILILVPVIGAAEVGVVYLVMRAMALPVTLVGASISLVFLAGATKRRQSGTLGAFTRKIMWHAFLVGGPTITAIGGFAYLLGPWILGEGYEFVQEIALWMVPWFVMQAVYTPVSTLFASTNRQSEWLALQALGFVIIVGGTLVATRLVPDSAVILFALANFAFYAIVNLALIRLSHRIEALS